MDLKSILEKSKSKVQKHHFKSSTPSIATHDRPYIIDFNELVNPVSNDALKKEQVTNRYQTGNKQVSEQVTTETQNGYQTGIKQVTNRYQTGNKQVTDQPLTGVQKKQTGNKQVSEQVTTETQNGYQTGNKQVSQQIINTTIKQIKEYSLTTLVGIQRSIIVFFYFLTKIHVGQSTPSLTLDYISNSLKIGKNVIKITIIRLQKKGLLIRNSGKTGRGGWSSYELSNALYKELMQQDNFGFLEDKTGIKQVTNEHQTGNKQVSQQVSQQVTSTLSSGSSIDLKTTTTNSNPARELPEGWRAIEHSFLAHIGFTQTHLLQLSKLESLEPSIVQDSIYHFAFDLKHNNKASSITKGDPLNYFMGIVSKRGAYTAPSNYIDPILEVMNSYHKTKEQSEKQKTEIEQKVQEIEFRTWHDSLSDNEILELLPEEILKAAGVPASVRLTLKINHLKKHYRETVWPERRRQLYVSTPNWTTVEPIAT